MCKTLQSVVKESRFKKSWKNGNFVKESRKKSEKKRGVANFAKSWRKWQIVLKDRDKTANLVKRSRKNPQILSKDYEKMQISEKEIEEKAHSS